MTTTHTLIRPGMTALAAVIALSSTAAFAQAQPEAAPVTIAPPAPTVEAAPAAIAPVAAPMISVAPPAPAEATTANASAPVETMKTTGTPVVHQPEASAAAETVTPVTRKATPVRRAEATAPAAPAPAATVATAKTVAATPPVTSAAPPVVREAAPAPVQPAAPLPIKATSGDDTLAIAGASGFALVMIAGGAYALTRRRRSDDEVYEEAFEPGVVTNDYAIAEPMVAAAPVATASPSPFAASADLPEDFDTSRFGRHVQAAYAGPTPENPSMSLRRRLARARFFDQRERMGESFEIAMPAEAATRRRPPARKDGFVTTLLGGRTNTGFRPAFQG